MLIMPAFQFCYPMSFFILVVRNNGLLHRTSRLFALRPFHTIYYMCLLYFRLHIQLPLYFEKVLFSTELEANSFSIKTIVN